MLVRGGVRRDSPADGGSGRAGRAARSPAGANVKEKEHSETIPSYHNDHPAFSRRSRHGTVPGVQQLVHGPPSGSGCGRL